jgi:hypothetical protein
MLARALIQAVAHPQSEAKAIQEALEQQKRFDLFEIRCQTCGGLGVVIDLANRWYEGDEMVYGSKRCRECDGLGSPRG